MLLDFGISFAATQIDEICRRQFRLDFIQICLAQFTGKLVSIHAKIEHERDVLLRPFRRIGIVAHLLRILDTCLVCSLRLVLGNLWKTVRH